MPNRRMPGRLDHFARPRVGGPRPLKWQPLAVLFMATAIFLYFLIDPMSPLHFMVLNLVGPFLFIASALMPSSGPFRPYKDKRTSEGMDEREDLIWRDAQLFSLSMVVGLQVMGFPALIAFAFTGSWSSSKILLVLGVFLFYLGIVFTCLLTLHGSWHMQAPDPEGD